MPELDDVVPMKLIWKPVPVLLMEPALIVYLSSDVLTSEAMVSVTVGYEAKLTSWIVMVDGSVLTDVQVMGIEEPIS